MIKGDNYMIESLDSTISMTYSLETLKVISPKKDNLGSVNTIMSKRVENRWESTEKEKVDEKQKIDIGSLTLIDWAEEYTCFIGRHFTIDTFIETRKAFGELLLRFDFEIKLESIKPSEIEKYIMRDEILGSESVLRKYLRVFYAAWEWGKTSMDEFPKGYPNPFKICQNK